jgi:hypothetical protein
MENEPFVMALLDICKEVFHRDRGLVGVELDLDVPHAGFQKNHGVASFFMETFYATPVFLEKRAA